MALLGGALALSGVLAVPEAASAATSTRGLLAGLTVAAEHSRGLAAAARPRWSDLDADGCLTSQQVLLRDARTPPREAAGCRLTGGAWVGALDGARLTGADVRVAQLVPFGEAWRSGAWRWSARERRVMANDLGYAGSLLVASVPSLRERDDQPPEDWSPDSASLRCRYLARWVAVKQRWHLSVDPAEKAALSDGLADCGWPRVAVPRTPPIPSVRGLAATAVSARAMVAGCQVSSGDRTDVVVRFGRDGAGLTRRSAEVTTPPGTREVRVTLTGLLPDTTYRFQCAASTPTAGTWRAPTVLAVTRALAVPTPTPSPGDVPPTTEPGPAPVTLAPTTAPSTPPPTSPPPPTETKIVAVGDLCTPDPATCSTTGTLAAGLNPSLYLLLGDTQYETGRIAEYDNGYKLSTWNALRPLSKPVIGNHEVADSHAFDAPAPGFCGYFYPGSTCPRWYAFDIDSSWRAIVLDSNQPGNPAQLQWLDDQLASVGSRNLLVSWHHPPWRNSGSSGHTDSSVNGLVQKVFQARADIVLWGHDHMYTRWKKVGPTKADPNGFRAFTVGTGGADLVGQVQSPPFAWSEVNKVENGVLELTLRPGDYSWRFVATRTTSDGRPIVDDSGTDTVTP